VDLYDAQLKLQVVGVKKRKQLAEAQILRRSGLQAQPTSARAASGSTSAIIETLSISP
jgi:hypothetical protein